MNVYTDVLDAFPRILQVFGDQGWDTDSVRSVLLGSPSIPWRFDYTRTVNITSIWVHVSSTFSVDTGTNVLVQSSPPSVQPK